MAAVRRLSEVRIWGRDPKKAEELASSVSDQTGLNVRPTDDPRRAAECDIVCTVTGSSTPILEGDWVNPGTHINLVGAHSLKTREADTTLVSKATVYVDLKESMLNEGGDIMIPIHEGALKESDVVGELGQLVAGEIPGRASPEQITVYNSLGITAQDLIAAQRVYERAVELGLGIDADL